MENKCIFGMKVKIGGRWFWHTCAHFKPFIAGGVPGSEALPVYLSYKEAQLKGWRQVEQSRTSPAEPVRWMCPECVKAVKK